MLGSVMEGPFLHFQHFHHLRVHLKLVVVTLSCILEFKFSYKKHENVVVTETKFMI